MLEDLDRLREEHDKLAMSPRLRALINESEQVYRKLLPLWARILVEVNRLARGDFTEEEFQNLCHNFETNDLMRHRAGCHKYQSQLFGCTDPRQQYADLLWHLDEAANTGLDLSPGDPLAAAAAAAIRALLGVCPQPDVKTP